ncbi:MAG: hypothetical protein EBU46_00570 [Nitrosomonadaceae bacterium]|nr:hypothetical protein [Nitrosomonadaceae bacterium]
MNPNDQCIILVPVAHRIEPECDESLRSLEKLGYNVWRCYGFSAIDQGRNVMAQTALDKGYKELMWIDSDVVFKVSDVMRLRQLDLPMSCGIYGLKDGSGRPAADLDGRKIVGTQLSEIRAVGAGFLHTRREVYEKIAVELKLQRCTGRHTNYYPYFLPAIKDGFYLGEDFAFCHRAREVGYKLIADTGIKLKHLGKMAFSWSGVTTDNAEPTYTPFSVEEEPTLEDKDDIVAITCFFNPAKFKQNLKNYHRFKAYMQKIGCPLYTIELAFDDAPWELAKDEFTVQMRSETVLWHKERLLNLLAKQLPAKYTKIIWTDCDLEWPEMPDWYRRTSLLLDRCKIVQPFSICDYLTVNDTVEFFKEGVVAAKKRGKENVTNFYPFHPGFVWAARREFFERFGLYDTPIMGSGDSYMAFAFLGQPNAIFEKQAAHYSFCKELVKDFLVWAHPVSKYVNNEIGYIDTRIVHMWHGTMKERQYDARMRSCQNFVPSRDAELDTNGLWKWSANIDPAFKATVRNYFASRKEDPVVYQGPQTTGVITAVDSCYFNALLWWWEAVKRNATTLNVIVYDLGLSYDQKQQAAAAGINLVAANPYHFDGPPRNDLTAQIPRWELCCWMKPFLIKRSPFHNNIWIDVDALIIRSIDELVSLVKQQPFIMPDIYNPDVTPNKPELYQQLPIYAAIDDTVKINAGIIGINPNRDSQLFDQWIDCCYQALRNPEIRASVSWSDQGALIWALQRSQRQSTTILDAAVRFNCPANFTKGGKEGGQRKSYKDSGYQFLEELAVDHPSTNIVHWMGNGKLELWPKWG